MNLKEDGKTWNDYLGMSVEDRKAEEKKAQAPDESMLFIFGCNSDAMRADLKNMSSYAQEKYAQDIEAVCNIYCTEYSKTTKSNNSNEGNTKQALSFVYYH